MMRDRPLLILMIAAMASYPALALGWCVAVLLGSDAQVRGLGQVGWANALGAVVLMLVGAIAIANATRVLTRGLRQTYRVHRWVARRRVSPVEEVAAEIASSGRVNIVDAPEQLAITVGLWRPYVVVSASMLTAVSSAELRAILAHEHAHVRRRDPLRLLACRVLAAHLWFVPLATDMRNRARRGYELIADRDALDSCGRAAMAGALLRTATSPATMSAAAAAFSTPELLEARVSQLESGLPPRPAAIRKLHSAGTAAVAMVFVVTVAGAWAFMLATCPCATGMG